MLDIYAHYKYFFIHVKNIKIFEEIKILKRKNILLKFKSRI